MTNSEALRHLQELRHRIETRTSAMRRLAEEKPEHVEALGVAIRTLALLVELARQPSAAEGEEADHEV
jgi:hypothetical protein